MPFHARWLHLLLCACMFLNNSVGCIYVLNPNWFFRSVWSIVCLFLDPVTKTKVEFVPHASIETKLRSLVSEDMLLQEYGGSSLHPAGMHVYMDKSYPPGKDERMNAMEIVAMHSQSWYKSMKARQAWALASDDNKVKRALAATALQQGGCVLLSLCICLVCYIQFVILQTKDG